MSLDDSDEKLALLREIRDEMRGLGRDIHRGIVGLGGETHGLPRKIDQDLDRLDRLAAGMRRGLDRIDAALADYAEQVRLTVHDLRVLAEQSGIEIEPV